jgi:glycerophosphoryl diester phosphodiesterase
MIQKLIIAVTWGGLVMANTNPNIEVQGHRGARGMRPENTLSAFQYALENNVAVLEMDLSYTKDHKLILSHDEKVNPTICLDSKGNKVTKDIYIHEITLREAQKFDCGTLINPRFTTQKPSSKEKMPTFDEVLTLVNNFEKNKTPTTKLNVEIKVHNDFIKANVPEIARKIIASVKKHKLYDRTIIQSFDINVVSEVRRLDSKIKTSFLIEEKLPTILQSLNLKTSSDLVKKYKFNILSPDFKVITKQDVKDFQGQGIQVIPWTANDPMDWKTLVDMEVDGIISDYPVALMDFLNKKTN